MTYYNLYRKEHQPNTVGTFYDVQLCTSIINNIPAIKGYRIGKNIMSSKTTKEATETVNAPIECKIKTVKVIYTNVNGTDINLHFISDKMVTEYQLKNKQVYMQTKKDLSGAWYAVALEDYDKKVSASTAIKAVVASTQEILQNSKMSDSEKLALINKQFNVQ